MNIETLRSFFTFVVLLLAQVLVLNHIHLLNCATPLLYVYFVLHFRRNYPKWGVLLWSFSLGLMVDIFSNTPGVVAASMTILGALQPVLLNLFIPRDARETGEDVIPSMRTMGGSSFVYYALIMVLVYCLLFFTFETFTFFNWLQWLECVLGSYLITMILLLTIENFRK